MENRVYKSRAVALQEVISNAAAHRRDDYRSRLRAYEDAKRQVSSLVGWQSTHPNDRDDLEYDNAMREIVGVLRL